LSNHRLDPRRKTIEPGAKIDRTAGNEDLRPRRKLIMPSPFIAQ
jgi:hypothetical protein